MFKYNPRVRVVFGWETAMVRSIVYGNFEDKRLLNVGIHDVGGQTIDYNVDLPLIITTLSDDAATLVRRILHNSSQKGIVEPSEAEESAHNCLDSILKLAPYMGGEMINPNMKGFSGTMQFTDHYMSAFPFHRTLTGASSEIDFKRGYQKDIHIYRDRINNPNSHDLFGIRGLESTHNARIKIRDLQNEGPGIDPVAYMDSLLYTALQAKPYGTEINLTNDMNLLYPVFKTLEVYGTFDQGYYKKLHFVLDGDTRDIPRGAHALIRIPNLTFLPGMRRSLLSLASDYGKMPPSYSTTQNFMIGLIVSLEIDKVNGKLDFEETPKYKNHFNATSSGI